MDKKMSHSEVRKLMKRNEAQEVVTAAKDYMSKNLENMIIAAVIIVIVAVAIPLYLNSRAGNELKAEQALSEANYYTNRPVIDDKQASMYGFFRTKKEKYEKVQSAYMSVLQGYKGTKAEPSAYLGLANAYYNNAQYKEAYEYFSTFIEKFPRHELIAEAKSGRAYVNFQDGKYADAKAEWEVILKDYNGGIVPFDVKLRIAESDLKLNDKQGAKAICEQMLKDTKDNYWANSAKDLLSKTN